MFVPVINKCCSISKGNYRSKYVWGIVKSNTSVIETTTNNDYIELQFYVSIRSTYTNRVVVLDSTEGASFILKCSLRGLIEESTSFEDMCLLASSIVIKSVINLDSDKYCFNLGAYSSVQPIGVVNHKGLPYVYLHVIICDDIIKDIDINLKKGFKFVDISTIKDCSIEPENYLKDSLIII